MLSEKQIKNGDFGFNDFQLDKYAFGGLDQAVTTKKTIRERLEKPSPEEKKKAKNAKKALDRLNETGE